MQTMADLRAVVASELQSRLEDFATRRADTMPSQEEWRRVLELRKELRAIDKSAGVGSRAQESPMTIDEQRQWIARLVAQRDQATAEARRFLQDVQEDGRDHLNEREAARFAVMRRNISKLDKRIEEGRATLGRLGARNEGLQVLRERQGLACAQRKRGVPASTFSPLNFDLEELRAVHERVKRGEAAGFKTKRDFNSAEGFLPAELYNIPTFPRHERRLLEFLPGFALDAPSLEYIQVNSVTGAAAPVDEGALKPELIMNTSHVIVTAQKLAAHTGISYESAQDWTAFTTAVTVELTKQVVDAENEFLLSGIVSGGTTPVVETPGLLNTTGILTHHITSETALDAVEMSVAQLRTGPSLCEPDLLVLHPTTWSAIRRQKDGYQRYMVAPDPTQDEAQSLWGIRVLPTTSIAAGVGCLLDTRTFGRVAVREPIGVRIGWTGTDFTQNIWRYVAEERLCLAVERPRSLGR